MSHESLPFSIGEFKKGKYRVTTLSGFKVDVLSTDSVDSEDKYAIKGYIGKSTQLETWTVNGKYYAKEKKKEKYPNQNNLILTK